jgi:hypothetical protein
MPESIGPIYYVAPTGSDANPGTFDAPFRTIAKARDVLDVNDGGRAKVLPGEYREGVVEFQDVACPVSSPCTIEAYDPANKPRIDALEFLGAATYGWRVRNLEADSPDTAFGFKIDYTSDSADSASWIELYGNHIHGQRNGSGFAQGVLVTGDPHDLWILSNNIHDVGGLEGNESMNLEHPLYLQNGTRVVAANNVMWDYDFGYCLHIYNGSESPALHDSWIVNNTCGGGSYGGLLVEGESHAPYNNQIRNNILTYPTTSTYCITLRGADPVAPNAIDHNLIWGCPGAIHRGSASLDTPTNTLEADSAFVDRLAGDLHLGAGSPAIDYGVLAYTPPTDAEGRARERPDAGALAGP